MIFLLRVAVCVCVQLDDLHALLDNVSAERDAALGGATAAANGEDLPAKVEAMQAEVSQKSRLCCKRVSKAPTDPELLDLFFYFQVCKCWSCVSYNATAISSSDWSKEREL